MDIKQFTTVLTSLKKYCNNDKYCKIYHHNIVDILQFFTVNWKYFYSRVIRSVTNAPQRTHKNMGREKWRKKGKRRTGKGEERKKKGKKRGKKENNFVRGKL